MTIATATAPAPTTGAGVVAGLNPAQLEAWRRLQAARDAMADLEPLDPHYLAAEHAWEQARQRNGDDC